MTTDPERLSMADRKAILARHRGQSPRFYVRAVDERLEIHDRDDDGAERGPVAVMSDTDEGYVLQAETWCRSRGDVFALDAEITRQERECSELRETMREYLPFVGEVEARLASMQAELDLRGRWLERNITDEDALRVALSQLARGAFDAPNASEIHVIVSDQGRERGAHVAVRWDDGESLHALLAREREARAGAEREVERLGALCRAWEAAADAISPSDHTPEALVRHGERLHRVADNTTALLREIARLHAESRAAEFSEVERIILGLLGPEGEKSGTELVAASDGKLRRGTVYVALGRMEAKGLVASTQDAPSGRGGPQGRRYRADGTAKVWLRQGGADTESVDAAIDAIEATNRATLAEAKRIANAYNAISERLGDDNAPCYEARIGEAGGPLLTMNDVVLVEFVRSTLAGALRRISGGCERILLRFYVRDPKPGAPIGPVASTATTPDGTLVSTMSTELQAFAAGPTPPDPEGRYNHLAKPHLCALGYGCMEVVPGGQLGCRTHNAELTPEECYQLATRWMDGAAFDALVEATIRRVMDATRARSNAAP